MDIKGYKMICDNYGCIHAKNCKNSIVWLTDNDIKVVNGILRDFSTYGSGTSWQDSNGIHYKSSAICGAPDYNSWVKGE